MMNFFKTILTFLNTYKLPIILVVVLLAGLIITIIFRKKIYKLIVNAETGALTAMGMWNTIDKIQRSDLDERMVLVIAKIITSVPILKLLPTKLVVKTLNKIVQKVFDSVKELLDAKAKTLLAKYNNSEEKYKEFKQLVEDYNINIDALIEMVKLGKVLPVKEVKDVMEEITDNINKVADEATAINNTIDRVSESIGIEAPGLSDVNIPTEAKLDKAIDKLGENVTLDLGKIFGE